MTNGDKIRIWRESKGLSKEAVAAAINKSLGTVRNLEAGKPAEAETLFKLARLMNCQMEELVVPQEQTRRAS